MPDLHHAIQISATPQVVYPMVATGQGFTKWWAEDVVDTGDGAELSFFKRSTVYRLKLLSSQAGALVEWACETGKEWAGTRLIFRIEARGASTLVRLTHAGWEANTDYFVSCNTTWGELMFRLKAAAEGKTVGPLFLADGLAY